MVSVCKGATVHFPNDLKKNVLLKWPSLQPATLLDASIDWNESTRKRKMVTRLSFCWDSEVTPIVCQRRPPCHGQARQRLSSPGGAGGRSDAGVHCGRSPEESLWLDGWPQRILRKELRWCWGKHAGERPWGTKVGSAARAPFSGWLVFLELCCVQGTNNV